MGFGISNLIQKYTRPALIVYENEELQVEEIIKPDVKKSETHNYNSSVTEQALENGSIVSEHVVQKPLTVSLEFVETNNTVAARSTYLRNEFNSQLDRKTTFDKLVEIWENKSVCQIITEHKIYNNMVLTAAPIKHQAPFKASLSISCDFKQLNFAQPITTIYVGKSDDLTKAASATQNGGFQKLKTISITA